MARIIKDEKEHAEKEKFRKNRIERENFEKTLSTSKNGDKEEVTATKRHINLFNYEDGEMFELKRQEKRKKDEEENMKRLRIKPLQLGQSCSSKVRKPWYLEKEPKERVKLTNNEMKNLLDPLNEMNAMIKKTIEYEKLMKGYTSTDEDYESKKRSSSSYRKRKRTKSQRIKKRRKSRRKY